MSPLVFKNLSENTLLIEWPDEINKDILHEIADFQQSISDSNASGIVECYPAYRSLLVTFNPESTSSDQLAQQITSLNKSPNRTSPTLWRLPVCYSPEMASDLETFSKSKNLETSEVIRIHSQAKYLVYFFGFLPGFMYLGGLNEKLHYPRKKDPDRAIPPGSVGIGGSQTGIYPSTSPGGWHIIGNCPIPMFSPHNDPPCFVQPGDEVRFEPIDQKHHALIKKDLKNETFSFDSLKDG